MASPSRCLKKSPKQLGSVRVPLAAWILVLCVGHPFMGCQALAAQEPGPQRGSRAGVEEPGPRRHLPDGQQLLRAHHLEKVLGFAETYPGYQELLRGAAAGLGAIARPGNAAVLGTLFDVGNPSQDPVRAPVTLAIGLVALRNMPLMLKTLEARPDRDGALGILAEAFNMLEEDLEEERFFVDVRHAYWAAPDSSPTRKLCEQLITKLDF